MEQTNHSEINGWGIDKEVKSRPGHPLEQEQKRPINFDTLQNQPPYTTTIPLRGLSGMVRKIAYAAPDWKVRRWLLLMLGDRIDVLESKLLPKVMIMQRKWGSIEHGQRQ